MLERILFYRSHVVSVRPHPNADRLELVQINNWSVVCKKGDFQMGQQVMYFEIDSQIPSCGETEFLKNYCKEIEVDGAIKFEIKTIRLRGQISQGLVLPLTLNSSDGFRRFGGVTKKQEKLANCQDVKGHFPINIPKTQQEGCRI